MREVPNCLNRRYKALDELIQQLSSSPHGSEMDYPSPLSEPNDPSIKLMCEFWNILKEDPDCNLTQQVKQRMGIPSASNVYQPQNITCFMCKQGGEKKKDTGKSTCCYDESKLKCCGKKAASPTSSHSDSLQLSKVLCNLKQAASFDKKCDKKLSELMNTQKGLLDQITYLEEREKEGVQLLKQADCMWSCMEDTYKRRVEESSEKQKLLMKNLKEVETSNTKWRKNKKDLETQMSNINQCQQEIEEKLKQKTNDIKCINMEISEFTKRIECNTKDTDTAKKYLTHKKQTSDNKVGSIAVEIAHIKQLLCDENKIKYQKEADGKKYVKDARDDLQKICRILLHKKLENEDLRAEKQALLEEIDLLNQTMDQCKDRCMNKQKAIIDEIANVNNDISEFKVKCIRCHQCTDTVDVRKFCTDCPRCTEERDCIYEEGHCIPDNTMDCVCMSVKEKFLDNVFENMYTVLEKQSKTDPGKAVAEVVLNCLKRSRNGKINRETKKILQDFILHTVKKNLNLTIIGGAVKTRCELDPQTYEQLMLCLKQVTAAKPPKEDKGTGAKKESCRRWGGNSECNCPSGPAACICTKKAPPAPKDPAPNPPNTDKDDDPPETPACPHKGKPCGPDCAMHVPGGVGADVAKWIPSPCSDPTTCPPFSKSMRAAQCVLGPESLNSMPKSFMSTTPYVPDITGLDDLLTCKCGKIPVETCTCRGDLRSRPRERIIEEVMGRYIEVSPIEKVTSTYEHENTLRRFVDEGSNCSTTRANIRLVKLSSKQSKKYSQTRSSSSECILLEGNDAFIKMLKKKKYTHICKNINYNDVSQAKQLKKLFPNSEPKPRSRDADTELTVILDPKFYPPNVKMEENTSPLTSYITTCGSRYNERSSIETNVGVNNNNSSVNYMERDICDTVKNLMKDVIVSDNNAKINYGSGVEWMTVESIINKLSSPTSPRDNYSNITNEEVEVSNITFDSSKLSTKEKQISYVKYLLSSMVLDKITDDNVCCLSSSDFKSYQGSLGETAKRERYIDEIMNLQMNANATQNLLPTSSSPIYDNKTNMHKSCPKHFIQTMINKNEYLNTKCRCEDSKFRCNNKTITARTKKIKKSVNFHKYLSTNWDIERADYKEHENVFMVLPEKRKKSKR